MRSASTLRSVVSHKSLAGSRPTFATPFARVTLDAVNKAKAVLPDVSDCPYLHRDISRGVHSIKQCPLYPLRTQVGWLPLTTTDRVM